MDPIAVFGAVAVIGAVFVLWWAVSGESAEAVELRSPTDQPADLRSRILQTSASDRVASPLLERLGAFVRRWTPAGRLEVLSKKLVAAGSPAGWSTERVLGVKVVLAVIVGLLALVIVGNRGLLGVALTALAVFVGYYAPDVVLDRQVEHRQEAVRAELSDVIDQLSMMVQAGLGIDAAIGRAARSSDGPMADELTRVGHDVRVGISRGVALANLADRVDVAELRTFIAALAQAERLGAPVSQTLQIQAKELRLKRRQYAEEQAMKLPVKLLFPMVFCILPVLMIVVLAPAAIRIFDQFN